MQVFPTSKHRSHLSSQRLENSTARTSAPSLPPISSHDRGRELGGGWGIYVGEDTGSGLTERGDWGRREGETASDPRGVPYLELRIGGF